MSKRIPLTQGQFAVVDDIDFEWLNQWKWTAQKIRSRYYATRKDYQTVHPNTIYMHRLILQTPQGCVSHHLNGDGLDNQRHNLVTCSHSEHMQYHSSDHDERAKYLVDFGISLNLIRIENDLTLTELAALSGLASSCLSQIERGRSIPSDNTINRLKEVFPKSWPTSTNIHRRQIQSRGLGKRSGMTSHYVGISWSKRYQRWRAEIRVNRKLIYLGRFDSQEEAAMVWNAEALKRRGPKAKLNIIEKPRMRGSRECGALCATPSAPSTGSAFH